jgi:hypothetical protein
LGAFLGVSRQGEFENTRKKFEYVSEKFTTGNIFSGEDFFSGWICLTFFSFDFFVALVKRLSVRGTQKRDEKCFAESCIPPPPYQFFFIAFLGVSR